MANNVKLARISVELAQRINDGFTSAGVAVAGDTDGKVLTALQRMNFINKAMFKLFNDAWLSVKGDKKAFAQLFPELVVYASLGTTDDGIIEVASPIEDYFQLMAAAIKVDSLVFTQAAVLPSSSFQDVRDGSVLQARGSIYYPICIEIGRVIYFLPADTDEFTQRDVGITYLKIPVQPETTGSKVAGSFLTMSDATSDDSPFSNHWNSKIAEIAEQLFRTDAKE